MLMTFETVWYKAIPLGKPVNTMPTNAGNTHSISRRLHPVCVITTGDSRITPQVDTAANSGNANTVGSDWLRLRHKKLKWSGNKSGGDRKDNVVPRINRSG